MATSVEPVDSTISSLGEQQPFLVRYFDRLSLSLEAPWNAFTISALLSLVALWAYWMHATWAAWGNLTIDSGHEMYVPAMLARGKVLYRDIWFMYPPAGPYFNSYLFRIFGARLNVLYWAGSLSALGSAIFLYLAGMKLSSWLSGWAAGAVVILQAFQPSLFCFPLPYSFSTVYGCLTACLFVWLIVNVVTSPGRVWMWAAATVAAAALLLKLEFGTACYGTLGLLMISRALRRRSWLLFVKDVATTLPGLAGCAAVCYWMISLRGAEFITQENFMSWPTAFFMKKYGKMWLENTGFALTLPAFRDAMFRSFVPAGIILMLYCIFLWKGRGGRPIFLRVALFAAILAYFLFSSNIESSGILAAIFFPQDMVLYVAVAAAAAWWYFWRYGRADGSLAIPLVFSFTILLAFRILLDTEPTGYPIYYDGPAILCFLLLVRAGIPSFTVSKWKILVIEMAICLACASVAAKEARYVEGEVADFVPLATDYGTVRVPQPLANGYQIAIQFMKEQAAHGEAVLSIPEDTSLYFFSGTQPTTRYYLFTPGVMAPGAMTDELLRELEQKPARYLIWSNRIFPEYGVPVFGQDFDRPLGDYLHAHYQRVRSLTPYPASPYDWHADLWERKP